MYPDYRGFGYIVYSEFTLFALLLSCISSVVTSRALKVRISSGSITISSLLGAAASLIVVYVLGHLDFEYSFIIAIGVAVILPPFYQFLRTRRHGVQ